MLSPNLHNKIYQLEKELDHWKKNYVLRGDVQEECQKAALTAAKMAAARCIEIVDAHVGCDAICAKIKREFSL